MTKTYFGSPWNVWTNFFFALLYMALAYMNAKMGNQFNYGLNVGFAFCFLMITLYSQSNYQMRRVLWEALDAVHDAFKDLHQEILEKSKVESIAKQTA